MRDLVLVIASGGTIVEPPRAGRAAWGGQEAGQAGRRRDRAALTRLPGRRVPPFRPPGQPVPVLLDRAIRGWDVIYGGGGDDRTLLRVTPDELAGDGWEWINL